MSFGEVEDDANEHRRGRRFSQHEGVIGTGIEFTNNLTVIVFHQPLMIRPIV